MANIYRHIEAAKAAIQDTGGIWDQLNAQMATQPAPVAESGMGIWGMIVPDVVGGLWDKADHETVYLARTPTRTERPDLWRAAADETLILPKEGLLPVWDAALARTDATGKLDTEGTVRMMRADVANVWQRSADETLVMERREASIFAQQIRPRDMASFHPQRISGYALKKLGDTRGETYWVLKNLRTGAYIRLNAEQRFLWEQMDGKASVQDIAVAYMLEYGRLAINSLLLLLDQLQQKGFIEPLVDIYGAADRHLAERRANVLWRRIVRRFVNTEIALHGIDSAITRSYQVAGRWLFTLPVQVAMLVILVAGGAAFIGLLTGAIPREVSVLGGAGARAGVIALYVLQAITLLIHEWSHAIATKHYGREVRRGGFLLYLGMPAAFVDTTDIWMEPRRPRLVVSWAGPHSGFVLGGLASLVILANPGAVVSGILYQFALLTYITSFMNLNPLLKLDGYYILMDWLEIPRLRERSLAFIGQSLRDKLRKRESFSHEEKIFAVFGVLSALWTVLGVGLILLTAGQGVLRAIREAPVVAALVAILLAAGYGWRRWRRRA